MHVLLALLAALPSPTPLPTPVPPPPSSATLALRGALPGQADGTITLVIRCATPSAQRNTAEPPAVLVLEVTQAVEVHGGWFATQLPVAPSGFAGRPSVTCSFADQSAPGVTLGWVPVATAAFAMLLPNAVASAAGAAPTLSLSNARGAGFSASSTSASQPAAQINAISGTALTATTAGAGGRGVLGLGYDQFGAAIGLEARSNASAGAAGLFVNVGGGDLLHGTNALYGAPVFRVDHNGNVYSRGQLVTQFGPQGPAGNQGPAGPTGDAGVRGPPPDGRSFCVQTEHASCLGVCAGTYVLKESHSSPCAVISDTGPCTFGGNDGVCCVCGT